MSSSLFRVGIVGGTGYTGAELLRLLLCHPNVEVACITSRTESGLSVSQLFPNLRGRCSLVFSDPSTALLTECDVVFFATPNGIAMQQVRSLLNVGVKVIDLAADFRLRSVPEWESWYGMPHACPDILEEAVYGLPELNRERIRFARLVANPGCYPTAVQLGFLPLLQANAVDVKNLIADAKSGVSGAGRQAKISLLMAESSDTFKAYNVLGHRHLPEILQGLHQIAQAEKVGLTFVPHLTPMIRGIHATLYGRLHDPGLDVQSLFENHYRNEPFVDVMPVGSQPETRSVRGSNYCRVAVYKPQEASTVVVLSVIDNLVKGAAGQAIQNMNLMLGCEEKTGLTMLPIL